MSVTLQAGIEVRALALSEFLRAHDAELASACLSLARAFHAGGTLLVHGAGSAGSDAEHVVVEFMHPVIVGKRALPAVRAQAAIGGAGDVLLAITHGDGAELEALLQDARRRGLLSIALIGGGSATADHLLRVPATDRAVVQEVQETAYHVLWELVHVFLERPDLLAEQCVTCGDVAEQLRVTSAAGGTAVVENGSEVATDLVGDVRAGDVLLCHAGVALEKVVATDFLYPFLESGGGGGDLEAVKADVRASCLQKGEDVTALRAGIDVAAIEACAAAARERLSRGGRVLSFGNGGSATDAHDLAYDCLLAGHPAIALSADAATVTAVANDVGFENAFARQIIALGRERDVAVAISTSGSSPSVVAGLAEAHRRGLLTCAIVGYDGGAVAALPWLDHLLLVPGEYVPRLQEAQATVYHLLVGALG